LVGCEKNYIFLNVQIKLLVTEKFKIDPDITKAETLPASFYRNPDFFMAVRDLVFYKSWQWIGHQDLVDSGKNAYPFILLDGFLTEPMLLTRDKEDTISCLTNVCTHRGNLVVENTKTTKKLICGYHGRSFNLHGKMEHMPEFEKTENFPRPCDDLFEFPLQHWGPFLFVGLNPAFEIKEVLDAMNERVGFMPLQEFIPDEKRNKDYFIEANWALYCDNYLEGFHIPFVHEGLNAVLDYGNYETVLYDKMNLQIGYAEGTEEIFDLPEHHPDFGKKVAAYYYWVFPNMMFNFYPWGVSVNMVQPLQMNKTKISFYSYVYDPSKLDKGAGSQLDKVEMEDEAVVEGVQKGIRSRFYKAGRFSPTREKGVHHFHRLLAEFMNE
jgi:choline monooxygenase